MQTAAVDGNITQATFLEFIAEYTTADQLIAEAIAARKDLRKRIKGAGLRLRAFDRARAEAEKAADVYLEEDREFRRNMEWLGKPLGHQGDFFGAVPEGANGVAGEAINSSASEYDARLSEHQVRQVEQDGLNAGRIGNERGSNPWSAGSFLHEHWDEMWLLGQAEIARSMGSPEEPVVRRGPGRPPGVRNKPKDGVRAD
jgi:hypothetical protein